LVQAAALAAKKSGDKNDPRTAQAAYAAALAPVQADSAALAAAQAKPNKGIIRQFSSLNSSMSKGHFRTSSHFPPSLLNLLSLLQSESLSSTFAIFSNSSICR